MKRQKHFLPLSNLSFLLILLLCVTTCKEKRDVEPDFLSINDKNINFSAKSTAISVSVKTNVAAWKATVSSAASDWIQVKKKQNALIIRVSDNEELNKRSGEIYVTAGNAKETISIQQLGQKPEILLSENKFTLQSDGGDIEFSVTSNVDYDIVVENGVSWIKKRPDTSARGKMVTKKFVYTISDYDGAEDRATEIFVRQRDGDLEKSIRVTQKGLSEYAGVNTDDIKNDIKVPVARGYASSFQPGAGIEKSFDGDMNSLYHSSWNNQGANYFPITLDYFFSDQESIDYFIYHPRTDGGRNGHFKQTEIWVATENSPTLKKIMDYDFKGSGAAGKVIFENSLKNPKQIRVIVKSGVGDGQGFAACAEMEFYRQNPDNFDSSTIFTDQTCSELKPGITLADIQKIENNLYHTIALYMFRDVYPREFRIQEYRAWPHPDVFSRINKTSPLSLLDNPTGISVDSNEDLVVFVGDTHGYSINIKIQDLNKPNGDGYTNASYYPLSSGVNKIRTRNKGLIYLFYHTPEYESAPPIKVHFVTGKVNGYFDRQKHKAADWSKYLHGAVYEYFDVVGTQAHLTFPTEDLKRYASNNGDKLIAAYDELVNIEKEFMGLMKYNRPTINRAYFHAMYHSYMYSTSYRTAYNMNHEEVKRTVMDVNKFRSSPWGPAHEQGHSFQTRPGFRWHGMTEVSNNIHSLIVQTRFGNPSRLQTERMGRYNNRYEKAFNNSFVKHIPHPGEGDVFCKLVSLWQLQIYFADARGYEDYYKDFFEKVRTTNSRETPGEQQLDFVKMVCDVTKKDLTRFFERWGYLTPFDKDIDDYGNRRVLITREQIDNTLSEIKSRNYPVLSEKIEYICDANVQYFKNRSPIQKGSASKNGRKITMRGWRNVVAYEVYENDNLVFVSNHPTFDLDNAPTANTTVYAVAYDGQKTKVEF